MRRFPKSKAKPVAGICRLATTAFSFCIAQKAWSDSVSPLFTAPFSVKASDVQLSVSVYLVKLMQDQAGTPRNSL